jgi:hypothetical protein
VAGATVIGRGAGAGADRVVVVLRSTATTGAVLVVKLHDVETALPSASRASSPMVTSKVRPPTNGWSGV